MKIVPFFLALWCALAIAPAARAGSLPAARELPVGADYCAILRAFTSARDPRCPGVEAGARRAVDLTAGQEYSRAAAPITAGGPPGYFIRFAFNSVDLTPEYRAHLDRLAEVFRSQAMEGVCVRLVGHTDTVGSTEYNLRLSRARARMVEAHLRARKVLPDDQLSSAGLGESAPLPGIPGPHPLNRRVEILAKARTGERCD